MILFPSTYSPAVIPGGLNGYQTTIAVVNSTATTNAYSGTVTGVTSGDYVVITVNLLGNNTAHVAANYVVTLDGIAMTQVSVSADTSLVMPMSAIYAIKATSTGNLAWAIDTIVTCRSLAANAILVTGENATPVANQGAGSQLAADVATWTVPSAVTPVTAGNVFIGTVSIKGGDITGLGLTGGTVLIASNTGTNTASDNTFGDGYYLTPDTAAVSFQWDWTGVDRVSAAWIEIAKA